MEIISIIVPTWNQNESLTKFCEELLKQTFNDYKIYIIDDCSEISQKQFVPNSEKIEFIRSKRNLGQSAQRNIGISKAKGSLILCMDDDAFFIETTALEKISAYFKPNIGCVFFKIKEPGKGWLNPSLKNFEEIGNHMTCACVYSAEAIKKVGGFNPIFHSYGEETDVSLKLIKQGFKLIFAENVKVFHNYQPKKRSKEWHKRLSRNSTRNDLSNLIIHYPLVLMLIYFPLKFLSHLKFSVSKKEFAIESLVQNLIGMFQVIKNFNKIIRYRDPLTLKQLVNWLNIRI